MTADDIIRMTINNAKAALTNANELLAERTYEDADFDLLIQIVKDNEAFIRDQEHTLSLVNDGMI